MVYLPGYSHVSMSCLHRDTKLQVYFQSVTWTSGSDMQTGFKPVWEGASPWSLSEAVPLGEIAPPSGHSLSRLCTSKYSASAIWCQPHHHLTWYISLLPCSPLPIYAQGTPLWQRLGRWKIESFLDFNSSASLQTWNFPPPLLVIPTIFSSNPKLSTTSAIDLDRETPSVAVVEGIPMWVLFLSGPVQ